MRNCEGHANYRNRKKVKNVQYKDFYFYLIQGSVFSPEKFNSYAHFRRLWQENFINPGKTYFSPDYRESDTAAGFTWGRLHVSKASLWHGKINYLHLFLKQEVMIHKNWSVTEPQKLIFFVSSIWKVDNSENACFSGLWKVSGSADRIYIRFGFCRKKYTSFNKKKLYFWSF